MSLLYGSILFTSIPENERCAKLLGEPTFHAISSTLQPHSPVQIPHPFQSSRSRLSSIKTRHQFTYNQQWLEQYTIALIILMRLFILELLFKPPKLVFVLIILSLRTDGSCSTWYKAWKHETMTFVMSSLLGRKLQVP